jgi:predicted aspartyl protease
MSDKFEKAGTEMEISGVGGNQTAKLMRLATLQLGEFRIDKPTVLVAQDSAGMPIPDYIEGLLGMDVLRRYKIFINYAGRRVSFE